jgi:spermidine/putrescine transport system substrate-binding protein
VTPLQLPTRREILRDAGVVLGALALGPILAACARDEAPPSFTDEPAGILNFANWPLYIDKEKVADGQFVRPSLAAFTEQTGIQVNYREVIPDADVFFQQIEPYLAAERPTGWDIVVITNGITLTKMKNLGYLVELPADLRPNFGAHAGSFVRDPAYDIGNRYSMAWQSGVTGIAYDPEVTGRPITSLGDLFSDEFAGLVGMFGDIVDMPNLAMLAEGVTPEASTEEDWQRAAELLVRQRDSGVLAGYYSSNYIPALKRGDVAITMAWSGDIFAAKLGKDLPEQIEFVVPDEGALLWTDAMVIPQGAVHLADAITYMDHVYDPKVAAQIAQYVNYISPVPEAQPEIVRMAESVDDPQERDRLLQVAQSPLVFLTDEMAANLHEYRELATDEEAAAWEATFRKVFEG